MGSAHKLLIASTTDKTMNLNSVRNSRAALALFLGVGLSAFAVGQTAPTASTTNESGEKKETKMEKFEVTGSRIKRLDAETVNPVLEVSVAKIESQGFATLGDALRALPFNNGQALTPMDSGTSFTPGVSTINLRGLGNNNTLVLINGRRAVPYASPGFNGFQTVFDLNSIPDSAIEKIEILKDGGSAIYGSDAVAGVVNVKLRRDFQGVDTSVQFGNYGNTDGLMKKASFIVGSTTAKTSMVTTFDWQDQHSVFARDLKYSRNADLTSVAASSNLRYTATGWAGAGAGYSSEQAYLTDIEATDAIADGWADQRSSRGFPGYVVVPHVGTRSFLAPTNTPTVAGASRSPNYYNFNESAGMYPDVRKYSFYTTLKHDFTNDFYGFADVSFSRNNQQVYSAAAPADIETSIGLSAATKMVLPSYNPFNPWAVDITSGRRRLVELPNRISDVTADTPRVLLGVGGNLNGTGMLSDWTWEAAALYSKNSVNTISHGAADSRLQEALMGLTMLGNGTLSWNPTTPQADRTYFNWFGTNSQAMANFITVLNPTSASLEYWNYDISASGSLFDLPAGPVKLAIGAEHRLEKLANIKTDLNATGNIVGGDEGTSSWGQRSVSSVYAEADVPIVKKKIELQLAGRYEKYSDQGFQKRIRPKLGFKYRVNDWLALRASFSQSFKTPDLAYLFTAATTTFTSGKVADPVTRTSIDQLQIVVQGNPNLKPEVTDTYYAGFVIAPQKGRLNGFEASVDWFQYRQKDLLAQLSDYYGYAEFLTQAAAGNPLFAGKVVRDPATNAVLYVRDDYVNLLTGTYRGADLAVSYTWKTKRLGTLYFGADATWVDKIYVEDSDLVGSYLSPRWNGTAQINWTHGDWGANLFGIYRGKRDRDVSYGSIFDEGDTLYISYRVQSQFTLNASVTYRGFLKTTITVGGTNVLNTLPPVDPMSASGTTDGINDGQPAFWYFRMDRKF
jgi:iron complex outermembrane recepter protein